MRPMGTTDLIEAAVLVPVAERADGTSLIFIVRTDFGPHGGQVAFPGGRRAPQDASPVETALREFEEELGVPRSFLTVTDTLPALETRSTGYRVTPVVARLERTPAWRPDPREVEEVLEIPLSVLRDDANRGETARVGRVFPCIRAGEHVIWGLTHRILERVLPRLFPPGAPLAG
jgi:8-oxo-dGTP pyrophosphatase MutT (NUDIX family)